MRIGINKNLILVYITFVLIVISFVFIPAITKSTEFDYQGRCDACHTQAQDSFANVEPPRNIKCINCHSIIDFAPDLYSHTAATFDCIQCSQAELNVEGHPYQVIVGRPLQWMSINADLTKRIHEIKVYYPRWESIESDTLRGLYLLFGYFYDEVILALIILTIVIIFIKKRINK